VVDTGASSQKKNWSFHAQRPTHCVESMMAQHCCCAVVLPPPPPPWVDVNAVASPVVVGTAVVSVRVPGASDAQLTCTTKK
jgi:hypothetical protein